MKEGAMEWWREIERKGVKELKEELRAKELMKK